MEMLNYCNIFDLKTEKIWALNVLALLFRILWKTCTPCMDTAMHPAQPVQGSMSTMPSADGNILTDWKLILFAKIVRK